MEAIILAGGKAERLGDAAGGRPKSLVDVAGRPLVGYQIGRLARAGVDRVIVSCAAGQGPQFADELGGRGGGIKFAARERKETGDVYALNGDELVDVDFGALLARHREAGGAATVAIAQPKSPFGVVDLGADDVIEGFSEGGKIPYWVNCGIYVLSEEAIERFPEKGDHESTTFPELVAERRLHAYRHHGLWLTVNTPKELRAAGEHVAAHPEWLA